MHSLRHIEAGLSQRWTGPKATVKLDQLREMRVLNRVQLLNLQAHRQCKTGKKKSPGFQVVSVVWYNPWRLMNQGKDYLGRLHALEEAELLLYQEHVLTHVCNIFHSQIQSRSKQSSIGNTT